MKIDLHPGGTFPCARSQRQNSAKKTRNYYVQFSVKTLSVKAGCNLIVFVFLVLFFSNQVLAGDPVLPGNKKPATPVFSIVAQSLYVCSFTEWPAWPVLNESTKPAANKQAMVKSPMYLVAPVTSLTTNLYAFSNKGSIFLVDGNLAQFDDSYNAGVDWQDAKKFPNINETFGLLCNGVSLAADRRPMLAMNDTLFYNLTKTTQKEYQFELIAANLDRDNVAGFVNDNFLHTATPINMNGSTRLNFEVTADKASAAADRFMVVFKPSVEYTTVTATVLGSDIGVAWSVANEANIQSYIVERSADGVHFAAMGSQLAAGKNSTVTVYNWLDAAPALGTYYYRIRSVSYNDVRGYSNIVKIKLNRGTPAMYVFPNPVTENTIHLQMNGMAKGAYGVSLLNNLGQAVHNNFINHIGGTATESIAVGSKLSKGVYQLKITAPDTKITTIKVVVP